MSKSPVYFTGMMIAVKNAAVIWITWWHTCNLQVWKREMFALHHSRKKKKKHPDLLPQHTLNGALLSRGKKKKQTHNVQSIPCQCYSQWLCTSMVCGRFIEQLHPLWLCNYSIGRSQTEKFCQLYWFLRLAWTGYRFAPDLYVFNMYTKCCMLWDEQWQVMFMPVMCQGLISSTHST